MRTNKSYMIVIFHFKLYTALFPLKWLICIPNISAVRGNVVFETLHDVYRTTIISNRYSYILITTSPKEVIVCSVLPADMETL